MPIFFLYTWFTHLKGKAQANSPRNQLIVSHYKLVLLPPKIYYPGV